MLLCTDKGGFHAQGVISTPCIKTAADSLYSSSGRADCLPAEAQCIHQVDQ